MGLFSQTPARIACTPSSVTRWPFDNWRPDRAAYLEPHHPRDQETLERVTQGVIREISQCGQREQRVWRGAFRRTGFKETRVRQGEWGNGEWMRGQ